MKKIRWKKDDIFYPQKIGACVRACVRACVCVCVCERERACV